MTADKYFRRSCDISVTLPEARIDVSVTGGGRDEVEGRPAKRSEVCKNNWVLQVQPSAWLLLGLDSDKQKLTIN